MLWAPLSTEKVSVGYPGRVSVSVPSWAHPVMSSVWLSAVGSWMDSSLCHKSPRAAVVQEVTTENEACLFRKGVQAYEKKAWLHVGLSKYY